MNVARRRPIKVDLLVCPVRIDGRRCLYDFDIEATSERLEVREDEFAGRLNVGCGKYLAKLRDAECDENTDDAGVVAKVQVEVLIDGKGDRVIVKGYVDLGRRGGDNVVLHAGEDFLHVACAILV